MSAVRKLVFLSMCVFCISSCFCEEKYIDGVYEGESQSIYTNEPYWGQARIVIKDGTIADFTFQIFDKNLKIVFDKKYEEIFKGNQTYIMQCRNDFEGLSKYISEFNKTRNISGIDAISGATWSYNMFMDTVNKVLIKAQKAE